MIGLALEWAADDLGDTTAAVSFVAFGNFGRLVVCGRIDGRLNAYHGNSEPKMRGNIEGLGYKLVAVFRLTASPVQILILSRTTRVITPSEILEAVQGWEHGRLRHIAY